MRHQQLGGLGGNLGGDLGGDQNCTLGGNLGGEASSEVAKRQCAEGSVVRLRGPEHAFVLCFTASLQIRCVCALEI